MVNRKSDLQLLVDRYLLRSDRHPTPLDVRYLGRYQLDDVDVQRHGLERHISRCQSNAYVGHRQSLHDQGGLHIVCGGYHEGYSSLHLRSI